MPMKIGSHPFLTVDNRVGAQGPTLGAIFLYIIIYKNMDRGSK